MFLIIIIVNINLFIIFFNIRVFAGLNNFLYNNQTKTRVISYIILILLFTSIIITIFLLAIFSIKINFGKNVFNDTNKRCKFI